jgi:hypothetical protein
MHERSIFKAIKLQVLWAGIEITHNQNTVRYMLWIDAAKHEQVGVAGIT